MKVCTKCGKFCETKKVEKCSCPHFNNYIGCTLSTTVKKSCNCCEYNTFYTEGVSICCNYEVQEADKEAYTYLIVPQKLSLILNNKEATKEVERLTIETIRKDFEYLTKNPEKLKLLLEDHLESTEAIKFINNYEEA